MEHWETQVISIWCANGMEGAEGTWKGMLFCSCFVAGFNSKNKHNIQYPKLPSAIRPVPHGPGIPIPLHPRYLEKVDDSVSEESLSDRMLGV